MTDEHLKSMLTNTKSVLLDFAIRRDIEKFIHEKYGYDCPCKLTPEETAEIYLFIITKKY